MESLSIINGEGRKKHHRPPRIQKRKGKHYIHDTIYVKKEDLPKIISRTVSNMKRKPLGSKFSNEDNLSIQNKILLGVYKQLDRNMLGSNYSSYEPIGFKNHEGIINEVRNVLDLGQTDNVSSYIKKINELKDVKKAVDQKNIKKEEQKRRSAESKREQEELDRRGERLGIVVPERRGPGRPRGRTNSTTGQQAEDLDPAPTTSLYTTTTTTSAPPTTLPIVKEDQKLHSVGNNTYGNPTSPSETREQKGSEPDSPDISSIQDGSGVGVMAIPSIIKRVKEAVFFPAKELSNPFKSFMNKYGEYKILSAKIRRQPIGFLIDKVLNLISLGNFASAKKQLNYPDMFHLGILLTLELDGHKKEVVLEKLERPHFSESWKDDKQVEYLSVSIPKITLNEFVQNTIKKIGIHSFTQYGGFRGINCQNFIMDLLNANNSLTAEAKKFIYQPIEELIKKQPFWVDKIAQGVTDLSAKFKEFFGMGHSNSLPNGMDNRQIDKIFKSEPRYIGTLSRDGILNASSLIHHAIDQYGECCFIMNLDKHNQDMYEHWVAFYIDVDKTKTIYYYDPFGEALPFKQCLTDLHHIMNKLNIPYYLTFKQNNKKNQRINSNRCGIHCIVFLCKMLDGEDFYKATDSNEKEAIKEQKVLEGYGYI